MFPHADDYKWLMKNSYVAFHDRGQHVDVMLCDPQCKNGILDQMELEEAPQVVLPHFSFWAARASGSPQSSMRALQLTLLCITTCTVRHGIHSLGRTHAGRLP